MAALQGDKTLAELSSQYDVHVNQIQTWRNQLKDNMVSLFDSGIDQRKDHEEQIKSLQAKIGQLTMENDFLATVVNQRAKLTRVLGKTALKSFHPRLCKIRYFVGEPWSVNHGYNCRSQKTTSCQWREY